MKVISVYRQYFAAHCEYNDMLRQAAEVKLVSTYDEGHIKYEVSVNFFPYRDREDFLETFDAYAAREIYSAPGRRSKKREAAFIEAISGPADEAARSLGGQVFWDRPIGQAWLG